jgi:hemerythrin
MRDLLEQNKLPDNICILFVPILNVDGHEHFGPYNRINQNGPEEMGWRCTAQNLNLNRDYLKIDSPELQQCIRLINNYDPDFFIDCHTTDGADYQYHLTYGIEVFGNMDPALSSWQADQYLPYVEEQMFANKMPIFPYVAFKEWHNPKSGLRTMISPAMLSHGYFAIRNKPSLLIETHMLKDYRTRVEATYKMLEYSLDFINQDHKELMQIINEADHNTASKDFRKKLYPLSFKATEKTDIVEFLGIAYETKKSELTGGNVFYYQKGEKETMHLLLYNDIVPDKECILPDYYIIPPEWTEIIERIEMHGIKTESIHEEQSYTVVGYHFSDMKWDKTPYEGRIRLSYNYTPDTLSIVYPIGSVLINMNQTLALVTAHILEPASDGAFLHWGFFNSIFEQKEYSETYVMEPMATEMLNNDPELKAEYEQKKANDEVFAKNQWMQMNWFYQHTLYWDQRINRYPVGKIFNTLQD